ncbi:hypothetical protein H696_02637 [Fonticula alba]|uniref:Tetraspanin n=1 Tax=Fonticula alba TaxID=691883 RepID=A0A058Z8Q4_FONAL|nr:hypothetical protein H696_02637 [Fonticula alba]KCV70308.1 hypothetical protein H696_02637 [Fonticula alba]|eukprot:XP_009494824.1 hypothetical protein H696_02637 [Fonticula alba]
MTASDQSFAYRPVQILSSTPPPSRPYAHHDGGGFREDAGPGALSPGGAGPAGTTSHLDGEYSDAVEFAGAGPGHPAAALDPGAGPLHPDSATASLYLHGGSHSVTTNASSLSVNDVDARHYAMASPLLAGYSSTDRLDDDDAQARANAKQLDRLQRLKSATFWFSVLVLMLGGIVIGFSASTIVNSRMIFLIPMMPYSYVALGSFIFLTSFLGWYSSRRNSRRFLLAYIGLLLVAIISITSIVFYTHFHDRSEFPALLNQFWVDTYNANDPDGFIRDTECDFQCCGLDDPMEYAIPDTCITTSPGCAGEAWVYQGVCEPFIHREVLAMIAINQIVGIASVLLLGVGLTLACLTHKATPSRDDRQREFAAEVERLNRELALAGLN